MAQSSLSILSGASRRLFSNQSARLPTNAGLQSSWGPSVVAARTVRLGPGHGSIHPPFSKYVPLRVDAKKAYVDHKAWGMLTSIDAQGVNSDTIRSKVELKRYVDELVKLIDMKAYGPTRIEHFGANDAVKGYSVAQMIETSMISAHCAEATNSAYVDLFSCKAYDPKIAAEFTAKFFGAKSFEYNVLLRGATRK